jgi:plastocyanin
VKRLAAIGLSVVLLALAGCGSGVRPGKASARPHASGRSGDSNEVVMKNINFNPGKVYAHVGQTVTWTNRDDTPHNVTYASGPKFASSPTFTRGMTWRLKLTTPGVIRYMCTIHPGMNGTIVVTR